MRKLFVLFVLVSALLGSQLSAQRQKLDVTTFVVLGEGLAAGMADFSLRDVYQVKSFPAQMARQMGAIFPQPIIQSPGLGNAPGFPTLSVRVPVALQTTVRNDFPPNLFIFNLSIPGLKLADSLTRRPVAPLVQSNDVQQTLINFVLGSPALLVGPDLPLWTQVEYAQQMRPTFVIIELGYFDVLDAAAKGDLSLLPDVATFRSNYSKVLASLQAPDADIVVMTIPDPMDTGYFTTTTASTRLVGAPAAVISGLYNLKSDDLITVNGLVAIGNQILGKSVQALPPGSTISAAAATEIRNRVRALNTEINSLAQQNRAAVYDLNAFFSRVKNQGVRVGSKLLTADFLGGFYSLDGYYPGITGQALIANDALDLVNKTFGTSFKPVDAVALLSADPTVQAKADVGREYTLEELEEFIPNVRKMVSPEVLPESDNAAKTANSSRGEGTSSKATTPPKQRKSRPRGGSQ